MAKILIVDIETKPAKAYIWRMFKENVGVEQLIDPGGMICFGAKWYGDREVMFHADWMEGGRQAMLQAMWNLLNEADALVTFNGERFDLPKILGELAVAGFQAPPPPTHIDLFKTTKKFGFISGRLMFLAEMFGIGKKVKHEGFELWAKVLEGDLGAQIRMQRYCKQDVRLTERLYRRIKSYIYDHPHMGEHGKEACGACASTNYQHRGKRYTKSFIIERLQCTNCGSWRSGKRTMIK